MNIDSSYELRLISKNNYASSTATLQYKLADVQGSTGEDRPYYVNSGLTPTACFHEFDSFARPRNFFCIDPSNGDLYATVDSDRRFLPGFTYNFTIQVSDTTQYPPRIVPVALQVRMESNCQEPHSLYLKLVGEFHCDKSVLISSATVVPDGGYVQQNRNYSASLKDLAEAEEIFLVGLIRAPTFLTFKGELTLTVTGGRASSQGKLKSSGNKYMVLNSPLKVPSDRKLTISVHQDVQPDTSSIALDFSAVFFVFISSFAYCNHDPSCSQHWKEFYKSYKAKGNECDNVDRFFFYPKYGFCSGRKLILLRI